MNMNMYIFNISATGLGSSSALSCHRPAALANCSRRNRPATIENR